MSRFNERELRKILAPEPVEPPAGLLGRLRAEIPAELPRPMNGDGEATARQPGSGRVLRFPGARLVRALPGSPVWKLAAALLLVAGVGWLALRPEMAARRPGAEPQPAPASQADQGLEDAAADSVAASRRSGEVATPAGQDLERRRDEVEARRRELMERLASLKRLPAESQAEPAPPPPARPGPSTMNEERVSTAGRSGLRAPAPKAAPAATDAVFDLPEARVAIPKPLRQRTEGARVAGPPAAAFEEPAGAGGELRVRALSEDGQPLPGTTVELTDEAGKRVRFTDRVGEAVFSDVAPGHYQVRAHVGGFLRQTRELAKSKDVAQVVELSLPLAPFAEEIVVEDEAPVVATTGATAGCTVTFSGGRRAGRSTEPAPEEALAPPSETEEDLPDEAFFRRWGTHPFVDTADDALSTFGLDVDTGSYALVRRYLLEGRLPPAGAVRLEEMVNAVSYGDPPPADGDFAIQVEGVPSPFGHRPAIRLLRFGLRAREIDAESRKPAVLTFVVDVSGSMEGARLGLVKESLALLLDELRPDDSVALVAYSDTARLVLPHTADKEAVRRALGELAAGGSTNAEAGLVMGYLEARRAFREGAAHRVILASDGVANVGRTGPEEILGRVAEEAARGIELTTLGVGMGDYNDDLMEQLADRGDGRYAYIDDLAEARRVLVEELTGTLETVARDARVQVELNPETVERYRLLGYENRDIADERFRYEDEDAGEIGAGHAVSALYEVELRPEVPEEAPLAALRLRWRSVAENRWVEVERIVRRSELASSWRQAPPALRLAAAVAEWAELLRGSPWARPEDWEAVSRHARRAVEESYAGEIQKQELLELIEQSAAQARLAERLGPR